MQLKTLLDKIVHDSNNVMFKDVIAVIEASYHYHDCEFSNGLGGDQIVNAAGANSGSCKIFAFGLLNKLSEAQTLACFGDYYRNDVLLNPDGKDHQNIRNFMNSGWVGIHFNELPLVPK